MAFAGKCSLMSSSLINISFDLPFRIQFSHRKGMLSYAINHQMLRCACNSSWTDAFAACVSPKMRKKDEMVQQPRAESLEPNVRKAYLFAKRRERIKLPSYADSSGKRYQISEFLCHPCGMESMLNTKTLQSFYPLDHNTYRCCLQKIHLLNFEVAPVLDLHVAPTNEDCTVELLSCKFVGSKALESQNERFSAFMKNHMTWDENCAEPFLDCNVQLDIMLEVYMPLFTVLPISAVETPGNIIMQALVDKHVPLLLQQLLQDYHCWVQMQSQISPQTVPISSETNQELRESKGDSQLA